MFKSKQRLIAIPQWEHQKLAGICAVLGDGLTERAYLEQCAQELQARLRPLTPGVGPARAPGAFHAHTAHRLPRSAGDPPHSPGHPLTARRARRLRSR